MLENDIIAEVREYLHLSKEHKPNTKSREKYFSQSAPTKDTKLQNLEKFATNLNNLAAQGKFDKYRK